MSKFIAWVNYYLQNSDFLIEYILFSFAFSFLILFGMYIHIYFYQVWEKQCPMNQEYLIKILVLLTVISFANDIIYVIAKSLSLDFCHKFLFFLIICQAAFNIYQFSSIDIQGYYKTFTFYKYLWIIMNPVKTLFIYSQCKIGADLIKFFDSVWIINMMLIAMTDPQVNTEENTNLVVLYEIYFRYLEYFILIVTFTFLHNDKTIDQETKNRLYTTGALIGKYDSFKYYSILLLSHYFFPFINGFAFSFKYWTSFITIIPALMSIFAYRQRRIMRTYAIFSVVLIMNLMIYLWALNRSATSTKEELAIAIANGTRNNSLSL